MRHDVGYLCCLSQERRQCESLKTWDEREVETPTSFLVSIQYLLTACSGEFCKAFIFITMAKNKNEEFQSRRDFFKKAGKGILPVLGIMMLSNIPSIITAAEKTPSGCNTNCQIACHQNCYTFCEGSCKDTCKGTCKGSCLNDCYKGCKYQCDKSCRNTCEDTCRGYNNYS